MIQSDDELRAHTRSFKVINDDKKERSEIMPTIVYYPLLEKENAQVILDKIVAHFVSYAKETGENKTPRFNQRINNLVFCTQSGGDFKNKFLRALKVIGKSVEEQDLFESDLVYFKGDHKLKISTKSS